MPGVIYDTNFPAFCIVIWAVNYRSNNIFLYYHILEQVITHLKALGHFDSLVLGLTAAEMERFTDWQVDMSVSYKCLRTMKLNPQRCCFELCLLTTPKSDLLLLGNKQWQISVPQVQWNLKVPGSLCVSCCFSFGTWACLFVFRQ